MTLPATLEASAKFVPAMPRYSPGVAPSGNRSPGSAQAQRSSPRLSEMSRRTSPSAILRALGFTWQVRGTLCWQALTLAGIALLIGVPAGIACGRLCWQVFAHQLGITPVTAVPLAGLSVMAAGWLAAAAMITVLPGGAATGTARPESCTASSGH